MCIALAIAGGAALTAGGTAIAGNQAAKATEGATNAAVNEQNQALSSQQALSQPYQSIGTTGGAINQYENLLGLGPQGGAGAQAALAATPGYQFTQQQGNQATLNSASAAGLGLSGNTLEGLSKYNAGLADQTYQSAVGNAQNAVGIGQAAAAGQAANIGNAAGNISNALINQGNTTAGIDANTIAGLTKAGSNATSGLVTENTLSGLTNLDSASNDALLNPGSYAAGGGTTLAGGGGYTLNNPAAGF